MKTINKRILVVVAVALVVLLFTDILMYSMFSHAQEYALKTVNEHLFDAGVLINAGNIVDSEGDLVAHSEDGKRIYGATPSKRKALLHVLGDDEGFIDGGIQDTFRLELCGYNVINGINKDSNNTVHLSLEDYLCGMAYDLLDGYKGCVGIANYKTNELVCVASSMSYDIYDKPEEAIKENANGIYDGIYINRLFGGLYTPGSTFKCVTAMAAIENIDGIFDTTYYCDGTYETDGGEIICHDVHGEVTFREALNQSCNCAFAQIAQKVGKEKLAAAFSQAGLDKSYDTPDRLSTSSGSFNPKGEKANLELGWAGIGQSTTMVNPYGFLTYMCAIANGGTTKLPRMVSKADDGKKIIYEPVDVDSGISIPADVCSQLVDLMRSNVSDYYGDWNFDGYSMCGKTGTAEKDDGKSTAWFTGFSADEDFPYAIVVVVEDSGGGQSYALPIASALLNEIKNG